MGGFICYNCGSIYLNYKKMYAYKFLVDPKNPFNVHKMAKLELRKHIGSVLRVKSTHMKHGTWAQMIAPPPT